MLGVVFELFVVEENLFAGRKHELGAAVNACEDSILEFHCRFPVQGLAPKRPSLLTNLPVSGSLLSFVMLNKGPVRTKK